MCKKGLPRQAQADGKGTSSWQLGAAACAAAAIAALVLQGSTEVCPAGEGLGDGGWCGGEIFERELPPTTCNIPRRPFADLLSKEDFPEYPVIYTNATGGWPALETWQRDRMIGLVTDSPLDAGTPQDLVMKQFEIKGHMVANTSIADHLRAIRADPERYVFSKAIPHSMFRQHAPIPSFLEEDEWTKATLALGGSRSGMMFHAHDAAVCTVVYGKKRWLFFDAEAQDGGERGYRLQLKIEMSNMNLFENTYRKDAGFRKSWANIGWECVQEAGELMFVPPRLQHAVVNIGETVAMVYERCPAFGENIDAQGQAAADNGHPSCARKLIERQKAEHVKHPRTPATKLTLGE